MRNLFVFLGLWLAVCVGVQPASAAPLVGGRTPVLSGGACAGKWLSIDFAANAGAGQYCFEGQKYGSFLGIPGASVSRSSVENCIWSDGHVTQAPANQLCTTDLGVQIWESRTNVFLNNATGATQTVTTTAASWTLSFWGTGSIVMTGTCSGTLNGSGATMRVTLTLTATAGSCVLTVSGSTTNVQMEAGTFASPPITTGAGAATRAADVLQLAFGIPPQGSIVVDYTVPHATNRNELFYLSDSGNSRFAMRSNGTGIDPSAAIGNGTAISGFGVTSDNPAVGTRAKVALAYSSLSALVTLVVNGTDHTADTGATQAQAVAATLALPIYIGSLAGSNQHDDNIRAVAVYPAPYPAAQLQRLTR